MMVQNLGKFKASSLLAAHILSGCDIISRIGKNAAVSKQMDSTLSLFGQSQQAKAGILQYLVKLLERAGECNTFDDLRYHLYMNKRKTISELLLASYRMMRHILGSHCFGYIYRSFYHPQKSINLNSINFGWKREKWSLHACKVVQKSTC